MSGSVDQLLSPGRKLSTASHSKQSIGILWKFIVYLGVIGIVIVGLKWKEQIEGVVVDLSPSVDGTKSLTISASNKPPDVEWKKVDIDAINLELSSVEVQKMAASLPGGMINNRLCFVNSV